MAPKHVSLVGQPFGLLVVDKYGGKVNGHHYWWATCSNCGTQKLHGAANLKRAKTCRHCNGLPQGQAGLSRLFKQYSDKAAASGRDFALSLEAFRKLTSLPCHYCGVHPSQKMTTGNAKHTPWGDYAYNGVDRMNNALGYIEDNCVPCCWTCNSRKRSMPHQQFLNWIARVKDHRSEKCRPKIQVLVGMIASGKSTYCKNAAKSGAVVVNDDSVVNMIHADDYTLYSEELKTLYKSTENHIISHALGMGRNVVIDRGLNLSQTGRRRWIALAKSFDTQVEAILFKIESLETHARRRADHDARGHDYEYWLKVANIHYAGYCRPTPAEGFDAIKAISFDEIKEGKVL